MSTYSQPVSSNCFAQSGKSSSSSVPADGWQRLAGSYHGSGCTLASACAALIAQNDDLSEAVREAQEYTWQTLQAGFRPGMGQFIPDRMFWARDEDDNGETH